MSRGVGIFALAALWFLVIIVAVVSAAETTAQPVPYFSENTNKNNDKGSTIIIGKQQRIRKRRSLRDEDYTKRARVQAAPRDREHPVNKLNTNTNNGFLFRNGGGNDAQDADSAVDEKDTASSSGFYTAPEQETVVNPYTLGADGYGTILGQEDEAHDNAMEQDRNEEDISGAMTSDGPAGAVVKGLKGSKEAKTKTTTKEAKGQPQGRTAKTTKNKTPEAKESKGRTAKEPKTDKPKGKTPKAPKAAEAVKEKAEKQTPEPKPPKTSAVKAEPKEIAPKEEKEVKKGVKGRTGPPADPKEPKDGKGGTKSDSDKKANTKEADTAPKGRKADKSEKSEKTEKGAGKKHYRAALPENFPKKKESKWGKDKKYTKTKGAKKKGSTLPLTEPEARTASGPPKFTARRGPRPETPLDNFPSFRDSSGRPISLRNQKPRSFVYLPKKPRHAASDEEIRVTGKLKKGKEKGAAKR